MFFVGCLFNKISDDDFNYKTIVQKMQEYNISNRYNSFVEIKNEINSILVNKTESSVFSSKEIKIYNEFSESLYKLIGEFNNEIIFEDDLNNIISNLNNIYYNNQLNEILYGKICSNIVSCFVKSNYRYSTKYELKIEILRNFLDLIKNSDKEKQNIIIKNIQAKLSCIQVFYDSYEDIPF